MKKIALARFMFVALASLFYPLAYGVGSMTHAELSSEAEQHVFIIELSGKTKYSTFSLSNPERLVIDLTKIDIESVKRILIPNELVSGVHGLRIGTPTPGTTRIVLDLNSGIAQLRSSEHSTKHKRQQIIVRWEMPLIKAVDRTIFPDDERSIRKLPPPQAPLAVSTQTNSAPTKPEAPARSVEIQKVKPEDIRFDISGFIIQGNTLLPENKIQKALAPFKGGWRSMVDIDIAAEVVRRLYVDAGYPAVQVSPPSQTITAGKVVLQVVEDRISSVTVSGNDAHTEENIKASLPPLQLGQSLNVNRLEKAITLANENPSKQLSVDIKPVDKLGDVDASITVNEDNVSKIMSTVENTGNPSTGPNRINLAYQNANLFNRDHALTLQYSSSTSYARDIYSFSSGYHLPFYGRGVSLDITAAYANSAMQNGAMYFAGKGNLAGVHLNFSLPNWGDMQQKVVVGADYKTNSNTVSGQTAAGNITEIPASAMYSFQVAHQAFQSNGSITYVSNLHGGSHADTASYQAARTSAGAKQAGPIWDLWRVNSTGGYSLPHDWQTRFTVNGQFTNDLLIPAEKFGVGGATSVRGYPERVADGDNGYTASFELYTPDIKKFESGYISSFRGLVFMDAGRVSQNDIPSAISAPRYDLCSYGLGLRISGKNTSLKVDLGATLKPFINPSNPSTNVNKGAVRGHVSYSSFF